MPHGERNMTTFIVEGHKPNGEPVSWETRTTWAIVRRSVRAHNKFKYKLRLFVVRGGVVFATK